MIAGETTGLYIIGRKSVRGMCEPVEVGECRRIRRNKEIKDTLQVKVTGKCTKSLRMRLFCQAA
jgi:hypothetical protein